jgi:MOSC domain-containing protein YiiM
MTVVAIHIGPHAAGELSPIESVLAIAGKGLEGDRHFRRDSAEPGAALTLVDEKEVTQAGLTAGGTRRQLTVRGVDLKALIGERFRVGAVECYGVRLCEPCLHLQKMTRPGILRELVHRAGINADILTTGHISLGDPVVRLSDAGNH